MTFQQPYFFDKQIYRILLQFSRIFAGFRVSNGKNSQGIEEFITVPCGFGDADRQALHMLMGNSENAIHSLPKIAVTFDSINPGSFKGRGNYQGNVENLLVTERNFDRNTGKYGSEVGNTYTVERLYPTPIDIMFKVEIWCSNEMQKMQLFEQIIILFNPSLDIQTTNSPLDWTALNTINLEGIIWNDQGITRGTDDIPNVLSMTFSTSCWINPPARVKKQNIIQTIIQRMAESVDATQGSIFSVITSGNHGIQVLNNQIFLLGNGQNLTDENGDIYSWPQLIDQYGELVVGTSRIALRWVEDIRDNSKDIIGLISLHPTIDNILMFDIITDTLPAATLAPVNGILDPRLEYVNAPSSGERYIITDAIASGTVAWGNLNADKGDIIQYNGSSWIVSNDASALTGDQFVINLANNHVLKLIDLEWVDIVNSKFKPGYFTIML